MKSEFEMVMEAFKDALDYLKLPVRKVQVTDETISLYMGEVNKNSYTVLDSITSIDTLSIGSRKINFLEWLEENKRRLLVVLP